MAENIVYTVLVGAAGLTAIVAATYGVSRFIDRFCSSPYATERIFSPVSNKAGLWGMGEKERKKVLEQVFASTVRIYDGTTTKNAETKAVEVEMTDLKAKADRPAEGELNQASLTETETESGAELESGGAVETDPLEPTNLCSICLAEFEKGEKVMTGTHCSHMYHSSCIMEWLQKGNDHCPFCRVDMMSAIEMRDAAVQALGTKRVNILSRPNIEIPVGATRAPSELNEAPRSPAEQNREGGEEPANSRRSGDFDV